jgi:hypothetical protein
VTFGTFRDHMVKTAGLSHPAVFMKRTWSLHFIECSRDAWTMRWLGALIKKCEAFTVAHFLTEDPVTGMVSLELEFGKDHDSREAMWKCMKEYRKGPPKRPKVGYDEARLHQRLYNNRLGKVQAGPKTPDGIIPLENEIVPEEVLRRCPLIPRDEEPFSIEQSAKRSEP